MAFMGPVDFVPDNPPEPYNFLATSPSRYASFNSIQESRRLSSPPTRSHQQQRSYDQNDPNTTPDRQHSISQVRSRDGSISMPSGVALALSRSPPSTKNTSHVPCKFVRTPGGCTAGNSCPFSHDPNIAPSQQVCEYFQKGNCKFGIKCALLHVLPNGMVANRPQGRQLPQYNGHPPRDHFTSSRLSPNVAFNAQYQQAHDSPWPEQSHDNLWGPHEDLSAGSGHTSPKAGPGSPRLSHSRFGSITEAKLPESFDSQGISYMARYGAQAASMPAKVNFLKNGSSKPTIYRNDSEVNSILTDGPDLLQQSLSPGMPQRFHSRVPSALGLSDIARRTQNEDWNDESILGGEEDYLPKELSDLLSPEERMRRLTPKETDGSRSSLHNTSSNLLSNSGHKSSYATGSSPSKFSAFFAKQRLDEDNSGTSSPGFAHVGSPLRNPSFTLGQTTRSTSGSLSPIASPNAPRSGSISMLSQQLSQAKLADKELPGTPLSLLLPIGSNRSNNTNNTNTRLAYERIKSSQSLKSDRDGDQEIFSLDEDDHHQVQQSSRDANESSLTSNGLPKSKPVATFTYASVAAKR